MACHFPQTAYYAKERNPNGKRSLVFNREQSSTGIPIRVPCNGCFACRLRFKTHWMMRNVHESKMHSESCFITLTYAPEHLPRDHSLKKRHFQLFMKRLRKHVAPKQIRYFACGEYGDESERAHYHALIYGHDFHDKKFLFTNKQGDRIYESETLYELWPLGINTVGAVTRHSANYVSGYAVKKIRGAAAQDHYTRLDPVTGELHELTSEFALMSRRPGIGYPWYEKYGAHALGRKGTVIINGKEVIAPAYYWRKWEAEHPETVASHKKEYRNLALQHRADNTPERRRVREQVLILNAQRLKRDVK
ncbi:MAG: replication initiator protein [Microvirus sp.]|nr:MAG: replication initiator protein [Microvirus sp.]